MKNQYKAVIFDVDGTLVPNNGTHVPSNNVINAVRQATKKVHVSIATSRPVFAIASFIKEFDLNGPLIVNGGAEIVNPKTRKTLWGKPMDPQAIKTMKEILDRYHINYWFTDSEKDFEDFDYDNPPLVYKAYVRGIDQDILEKILQEAEPISSLSLHKVPSWHSDKFDIHIAPAEGTKQHGVLELAKILKIDTHEIIGVGDGQNDFPLLMACGLKIAMGNAVDELKAIADYIAPTADKDGVVDIIEKFIL